METVRTSQQIKTVNQTCSHYWTAKNLKRKWKYYEANDRCASHFSLTPYERIVAGTQCQKVQATKHFYI